MCTVRSAHLSLAEGRIRDAVNINLSHLTQGILAVLDVPYTKGHTLQTFLGYA